MNITLEAGQPEHAGAISGLVWSTGPASYRYIFGTRELFDLFVEESWRTPQTYFGHTEAVVAMRGKEVVGVELSYDGARNYLARARLEEVWTRLITDGRMGMAELDGVLARAAKASYLNPFVPPSAWYLLALAVTEDMRGTGVGGQLLAAAIDRGRRGGRAEFHLDVLSDNPAVAFYQSRGLVSVAETVAPEPCRVHGVPMEMRMVLELSPTSSAQEGVHA